MQKNFLIAIFGDGFIAFLEMHRGFGNAVKVNERSSGIGKEEDHRAVDSEERVFHERGTRPL